MSQAVPFPDIAHVIRGASIAEAVEVFKALSRLATAIYQVNSYHCNDAPLHPNVKLARIRIVKSQMQDWSSRRSSHRNSNGVPSAHLLSTLPQEQVFAFIYEHVDNIIGDPNHVILDEQEVTRAEEWLVQCAIHPGVDYYGELRAIWMPYLQQQPQYHPNESAPEYYGKLMQAARLAPVTQPSLPGLALALQAFATEDSRSICAVIGEYIRLGVTAADLWAHMWLRHGVQRGQPLAVNEYHVDDAIRCINDSFSKHVSAWNNSTSLPVRKELAKLNVGGIFLYLLNHVFPNFIINDSSTVRENMFGWKIHQWILSAATTPYADPHGAVLRTILARDQNPHSTNSIAWYEPVPSYLVYHNLAQTLDQVDAPLEPYGRPIFLFEHAKQQRSPPPDSLCTICLESFGAFASGPPELACIQLKKCDHLFHFDCMNNWLNGSHRTTVNCPNCRMVICDARPRRRARQQ